MEEVRKQAPEVKEDPEGGRQSNLRGLGRGRGGQMRFIVGDGYEGEQRAGVEGPVQEEEGPEPGHEGEERG